MELIGVVRVPLTSLQPYRRPQLGRNHDDTKIRQLWKDFRDAGCDPLGKSHQVEAVVTHQELPFILEILGTTQEILGQSLRYESPGRSDYQLLSDYKLAIIHGRRRIKAGKGHTTWWAVKLFCVQGTWVSFPSTIAFESVETEHLVRTRAEASLNEVPYSDGALYRGIIEARNDGDDAREHLLRTRLSGPKKVSLDGLLKNDTLNNAFQSLLGFPGLIEGLQLGNIHKHIALHWDEHIEQFLRHVLQVWMQITNGDPTLILATDMNTVKHLQFRAPSVNSSDRLTIRRLIDDGVIYESVTNLDVREELKERMLSILVVIPSVETFHENMKYFGLGAKILNTYIKDPEPKKRTKTKLGLSESLKHDWKQPNSSSLKQGSQVLFQELPGLAPTSTLAYIVLFLTCIREFADLGFEAPRQDVRGIRMPANPNGHVIQYLASVADFLGFNNAKIRNILQSNPEQPPPRTFDPRRSRPAEWRAGKPFCTTYLALKEMAFLHVLHRHRPTQLSPAFILADLLKAFFPMQDVGNQLDPLSLPPARLDVPARIIPSNFPTAHEFSMDVPMDQHSRLDEITRLAPDREAMIQRRAAGVWSLPDLLDNSEENDITLPDADQYEVQTQNARPSVTMPGRRRQTRPIQPIRAMKPARQSSKGLPGIVKNTSSESSTRIRRKKNVEPLRKRVRFQNNLDIGEQRPLSEWPSLATGETTATSNATFDTGATSSSQGPTHSAGATPISQMTTHTLGDFASSRTELEMGFDDSDNEVVNRTERGPTNLQTAQPLSSESRTRARDDPASSIAGLIPAKSPDEPELTMKPRKLRKRPGPFHNEDEEEEEEEEEL